MQLIYGPDGDVYLSDWTDLGECHDNDGVHCTPGRIYKIIYGEPSPPMQENLWEMTNDELVALRQHDNEWYRRQSDLLLRECVVHKPRDEPGVPPVNPYPMPEPIPNNLHTESDLQLLRVWTSATNWTEEKAAGPIWTKTRQGLEGHGCRVPVPVGEGCELPSRVETEVDDRAGAARRSLARWNLPTRDNARQVRSGRRPGRVWRGIAAACSTQLHGSLQPSVAAFIKRRIHQTDSHCIPDLKPYDSFIYLSTMRILKSFCLAIVALSFTACGTVEQSGDPTEANYPTPDRIENQENVQEMHLDILRGDF